MKKPILVGQLSWPITEDTWLNCRAQMGWTQAVTDLHEHYECILFGSTPDKREFESVKDGCRLVFTKQENQGRWIQALKPDVIFWNDFPPIFRDWMPGLQSSKHIMRMHGDWRRFYSCWDVFRQAWKLVVPMLADPAICKAFGVKDAVRIPFCVDVPEMQGGKPWDERQVHFACPASAVFKGSEVMESVFSVLRKMGYRCEVAAWRERPALKELLHDTKVMFCPSAHEGLSRVCTESAVAGCKLVVSSESDPMVEQAGLLDGSCVSTDLIFDVPVGKWTHRRNPKAIAEDLAQILSRKHTPRQDWSAWDISAEVESLRELLIEAKP